MSRREFVELPAFQVFVNAIPSVDAYRRWFFANYSDAEKNKDFKARACLAFAGSRVHFTDAEIRDGVKRWHAEFGDRCPPEDVAAFVRFIAPVLSPSGRMALAAARAALRG